MPHKDPVRRKEYYEKNKEKNKEKRKEYKTKYYEERKQHAIDSITIGEIIDHRKWDMWCDEIKRSAERNKHPYSDEFTNDIMFEMMVKGCFYCGQLATTIDRLDSTLDHTLVNCEACCHGCNMSKSTSDSSTFIRKAYYRVRGKYYDGDTDIWFVNAKKPTRYQYKIRAKNQEVPFDISNEYFDILIGDDCDYCKRNPTTWFGIDKVIPSKGYVIGNVVSCCWDCNVDKLDDDVETMCVRNEQIADRVDAGEFILDKSEKTILHQGSQPSSKKVCVRGQVYSNMSAGSDALKMSDNYVGRCIRRGTYPNDIFEISEDFYNFMIDNQFENITKRMYILFTRM
jgi:hypothetical protein